MKISFQNTILGIAIVAFSLNVSAMSPTEYIQKYKDCAIEQMLVYNIPASVTLAQGILESDYGNSPLAKYANNHFGIKCHEDWTGDYYTYDDDEKGEHFRKYPSVDDSYRDHAQFLKSRPWYAFLFKYQRSDYRDWAVGLSKAGYATAKDYSQRLISIIQDNRLYVYDTVLQSLQGLGILYDVPPTIPASAETTPEYVVLKQGDGIYKIARQYNIDVSILCRINGISVNAKLAPGQKLFLKPQHKQSTMMNTAPTNCKPSSFYNNQPALLPRRIKVKNVTV